MSMLDKQLEGYRLTTAEITYHLPDAPCILQSFIWQELDLAPYFPELKTFLDFWQANLEGRLHSVRVAAAKVIMPPSTGAHRGASSFIKATNTGDWPCRPAKTGDKSLLLRAFVCGHRASMAPTSVPA